MNIGLVIEDYPPFAVGGAAQSTCQLARALSASGHKVVVVTPNYGAQAKEVEDGVFIYRYPFPQRLSPGEMARGLFLVNPLHYLYQALFLMWVIRREGLEVLHAQNSYSAVGSLLAGRLSHIKVFQTLRDTSTLCTGGQGCALPGEIISSRCGARNYLQCLTAFQRRNHPQLRWLGCMKFLLGGVHRGLDLLLRRWCLRRMDTIIPVSEGIRRLYLDCGFSECASRMVAVYNLPPPQAPRSSSSEEIHIKFGLPEGRPLVTYAAGKISFGKGAHILFEAIPLVMQKVPKALFVVVGSPNPAIPFPDSYRENGNLFHIPPLSNKEVIDLFSISSVMILPSTWPEPLARVLLEAMSLSKPVVGSRVGGIPEIIEDQVTGFVVKPGDPRELADRIADLLQDPVRAADMGQAGRALLGERFAPERILPRLLSIYQGSLPPPLNEVVSSGRVRKWI